MSDFYVIITDAGAALEAAALADGTTVELSTFGIDDGNGESITPDASQTSLINQVYSGPINSLSVSTDDASILVAQCVIPSTSGGYTIRGIGIFTKDGTLYAVGNFQDQVKPEPDSGYAASLDISVELAVSSTADITLTVTDGIYLTEAQGNTLYFRQDKMFKELADAGGDAQAEGRKNMGLGSASTYDIQADQYTPVVGTIPLNGDKVYFNSILFDDGVSSEDINDSPILRVFSAIDNDGNIFHYFSFSTHADIKGYINALGVYDSQKRVYSPVNEPPYPVTSVNGETGNVTVTVPEPDLSPYMKTVDADAKFVQQTRQSYDGGLAISYDESITAPVGSYLSGVIIDGSTYQFQNLYYRTAQYLVDGIWYNESQSGTPVSTAIIESPKILTTINNITVYAAPDNVAVTAEGKTVYLGLLVSAEGYNWYEALDNLQGGYFVAYDDSGIIWQFGEDPSRLNPAGFSVSGVDSIPSGCSVDGSWKFDSATQTVYQDADIVAARILASNTSLRLNYATQAALTITTLQAGFDTGQENDADSEALASWQGYLCDLRAMTPDDLQQSPAPFPTAPEPVF